jgi:beta-lactamase class A
MHRRALLLGAVTAPLALSLNALAGTASAAPGSSPAQAFTALEKSHGLRLGLWAIDTASGREIGHRAGERFPFCSTFKAIVAAAVLARSEGVGLLSQRITYSRADLVPWSPITEKHADTGMTVGELCAATIQYSDNTAGNLLIKLVGGPQAVTAFARSIGNQSFRLDRWETELNTSIPGDPRDTATPGDMARSMRDLVLGNALPAAGREQLQNWLLGNTTGTRRIRAGVPAQWKVGDKTGTGDYGTANDIGVLWPTGRPPIVLAIYTTHAAKTAKPSDPAIADAARIAVGALSAGTASAA